MHSILNNRPLEGVCMVFFKLTISQRLALDHHIVAQKNSSIKVNVEGESIITEMENKQQTSGCHQLSEVQLSVGSRSLLSPGKRISAINGQQHGSCHQAAEF